MPSLAHRCALGAGIVAACGVAFQPVGLALCVVLLLILGTASLAPAAPFRRRRVAFLALGAVLAVQPALRDAGWVVAVAVGGTLLAASAAVTTPDRWRSLVATICVPLRLAAGTRVAGRIVLRLLPARHAMRWVPVLRGIALAGALVAVFGVVFVTADAAFAELVGGLADLDLPLDELVLRVVLLVLVAGSASAIADAPGRATRDTAEPRQLAGAIELRIALGALLVLFAAFVVVQLQVLFGGVEHVRRTTGLGLGEYARQGFGQMLLAALLTLGLVAFAAPRADAVVRGMLGGLCALCLVVLVSAHHRLGLVVAAYGLTPLRVTGEAVVPWLAGLLLLVVAAGARAGVARHAPHVALLGTVAAMAAFLVSNPERRVGESAVHRQAQTGQVDRSALGALSADAVPALERLRGPDRRLVLQAIRARLGPDDGLAGWNLSRARAR